MIFREEHVSCVQSNDHKLLLILQARDYVREQMAVYFVVCSSLITFCRFLSLLGNAQKIYFWIAKAGSKSGRQGNFLHIFNSVVD